MIYEFLSNLLKILNTTATNASGSVIGNITPNTKHSS